MAAKITVVGVQDDRPLPAELKTKVQDALKTALQRELTVRPPPVGHYSVTHTSIVFTEE